MRLLIIIPLCWILLLSLGSNASADSDGKILLLYKQRDPDHQGILQIFTGFLRESGYAFDTRDVEKLLVSQPDMKQYSGIMTTFQSSQMIGADIYPAWLVDQMEAGRRILIIGTYGAYQGLIKKSDGTFIEWNESTQTINTFFYPFGLRFYFAFTGDNRKLNLLKADSPYAQFDVPLKQQQLNYYQLYKSVNPDNRVFFQVERRDMPDSISAFNVITPFGGMILEGYSYFWDAKKKKNYFRVNYPAFIKEVFSAKSPAVPKVEIKTHDELIKTYPLPERAPPKPDMPLQAHEIRRRVLMLYKKSEAKSIHELPIYHRASVILEYLGLIPTYHAVEDGLPDDNEMEKHQGIVTWHTKPHMYQAKKYGDWMLDQIENGKRVAILEHYGASIDLETQEPTSNQVEVMQAMGIKYVNRAERREEYLPAIRVVDDTFLGFEHEFLPSRISYQNTYQSTSPQNKVFLSYSDRDYGNVDLGIITKNGGVSLDLSPFYFPPHDSDRIELVNKALKGKVAPEIAEQPTVGAWNLNPYRFFSESLGLDQLPAADITTMNGSRIFYAHIDGDGLESISQIDGAHFAGYFIYENILKKYPGIPISVSVITKPIEVKGNKYFRPDAKLAQDIFALPNVDVAVHTATHPFDWVDGDPYVTNPDSYPYNIGYRQQNLVEEIWGAKLFVDHNLAPENKKTTTLFWSGATNPDEKALELVWRSGMHNLNGGDPRFDDEIPTLANLAPYSLPYQPYRQYLTSAQNDYYYTLFLTGDWGGQKKLLNHFNKTEKPYRIYPMNLYYHFYSGIKNESMDALKTIYDHVVSLDAAAIFTTQYLEIVEDFYQTQIGFDGHTYWVENNGFLRTIRFNGKKHVDMQLSEGVVGYSHRANNQTYVHLDGSRKRIIAFAKEEPKLPYIIQATQFIDNLKSTSGQMDFIYRGFGKTLIKIGGLIAGSEYQLSLKASDKDTMSSSLIADKSGVIKYRTQLESPQDLYSGTLRIKREKHD